MGVREITCWWLLLLHQGARASLVAWEAALRGDSTLFSCWLIRTLPTLDARSHMGVTWCGHRRYVVLLGGKQAASSLRRLRGSLLGQNQVFKRLLASHLLPIFNSLSVPLLAILKGARRSGWVHLGGLLGQQQFLHRRNWVGRREHSDWVDWTDSSSNLFLLGSLYRVLQVPLDGAELLIQVGGRIRHYLVDLSSCRANFVLEVRCTIIAAGMV